VAEQAIFVGEKACGGGVGWGFAEVAVCGVWECVFWRVAACGAGTVGWREIADCDGADKEWIGLEII